MSKLSLTEKILAEKTVCVLLVRGEAPDGSSIYAYVGVKADRLEEFMRAQSSGVFYPEEYGVVIEAGAGEPSSEVRLKMERDYGFNHEAMLDIPDADNATTIAAQLIRQSDDPTTYLIRYEHLPMTWNIMAARRRSLFVAKAQRI